MNYQCAKQTTVAIIMKEKKFICMGTNAIKNDVDECARKNMKPGEGYELCQSICKQYGHAEERACYMGGPLVKGGTLYLIGHTHSCIKCLNTMKSYGIEKLVICDTGEIIYLDRISE